ncbi:unnamed protein product [Rangifer tarandus platyrhynchus]|uniref:Uncharacterized protein n=1 Tax=Rangifer tarandus platyrhynchus TaxID=3082113 RepID=A0ABN8ZI00_RANTA|nr:unnamed protein product [Rangifer tarandus platyrhynchus]
MGAGVGAAGPSEGQTHPWPGHQDRGRAASACPAGQEKDTRGPRSLASTALTTGAGVISPLMSAAQLRPDGRLHRDAVQPPPPAPRWCPLGDTWASGFKKKAGHAVPSPWLHVHWQPEDFTAHVSEAEQASVLARCEGGPAGLTQPV